jgi:hypothetical protein
MTNTERPKHAIVNCETGVTEIVDFTDEEITAMQELSAQAQIEREQFEAEQEAKAEAKASALAKLAALGLTEDEAKAIAG